MGRLVNQVSIFLAVLLLTACASKMTIHDHQVEADKGDVESQLILANEYLLGSLEKPKNTELAIKYFQLASDSGSDEASFSLGRLYEKESRFNLAAHYYGLAADAGNLKAQDNLGIMYQDGRGVEKDLKKAESLYLAALSNGSQFSKRNLAVMYRDSQQSEKALAMFKALSYDPTTKNNSVYFKKALSFEIMDLYLAKNNHEQAYVWGSTGVLAGLFDSNISDAEAKRTRYEELVSGLREGQKNQLAKQVLINHYKTYQQHNPIIKKYQQSSVSNGLIRLSNKEQRELLADNLVQQDDIYKGIAYYKDKEDEKSRINFALYTLKMAAFDISFGAIYPYYSMAQSNMEEAIRVLNECDRSSIVNLKKNLVIKLDILKRIVSYQEALHTQLQAVKK